MSERSWKILTEADEVTSEIEGYVQECVDGWFLDTPLSTEEFIDQLCKTYGGSGYGEGDWDLDSFDSPATRKILRIARAYRKEALS